jgi:hypothetical protein
LNILVGVTGSSGVGELPMYLRVFREKLDANIRLVCTSNVQKFIDVNFLAAHANCLMQNKTLAKCKIKIKH